MEQSYADGVLRRARTYLDQDGNERYEPGDAADRPDTVVDVRLAPMPNGNGNGKHEPKPTPKPEPVFLRLSDVRPRSVEWLMRHWIPSGTLTVLDGDPGLAKSTLCLDLAARVSRGFAMPPGGGCVCEPAGVLLLSAEDDLECTIRPRLDAAEGDPTRVHVLDAIRTGDAERPPILPYDLCMVEDHVRQLGVKLVIIDPLTAFLGGDYDAHKDQDIRQCLHPLARLAGRLRLSIVLIRHLNKLSGGPALYRGGGSIGIAGAARCALIAGFDPADNGTRVLAVSKSNLGPVPPSLAYRLESVTDDITRIAWIGETDLKPADILWHPQGRGRPPAELEDAVAFISGTLTPGPIPAAEMLRRAEEAGISERTLKRAKVYANAESVQSSVGGWVWRIKGGQSARIPE